MATVRVYTAERMKRIEDESIVDGGVDEDGKLFFVQRNNTIINTGSNIIGPQGERGLTGEVSQAEFGPVDLRATEALSVGNSALIAANAALANTSSVVSASRTRDTNYSHHKLKFMNGAMITWTQFSKTLTFAFSQQGFMFNTVVDLFMPTEYYQSAVTVGGQQPPVIPGPIVSVSNFNLTGIGGGWANILAYNNATNKITVQLWSHINMSGSRNFAIAYTGFGYWKAP